ncbi:uncharacterized protein [Dermacentor andersoni]|uniref:uncharacterized protein n=1 Tax=Dermacentor andersoni TaxID=34620 RepID=UPI003B3BBBD5
MSSILGKVLERLMYGRLYYFLLARNYVHPNQFGFTHGRSAVMALQYLCQFIGEYRARGTPVTMVSLDFQGALDSVWHPLVLNYFPERQCPSNLVDLLRTFPSDSTVEFKCHSGVVTTDATLGSPQG